MSKKRSTDRLDWEALEGQQVPQSFAERVVLMLDGAADVAPPEGQLDWEAWDAQEPDRGFADQVAELAAETEQASASELGVETTASTAGEPLRGRGPARPVARPVPRLGWWRRLSRSQRQGLGAIALGAAAAVAMLVAFGRQEPDPTAVETPVAGWHGSVVDISRAAGGTVGLSICNPAGEQGEQCHAAQTGEAIRSGAVLRCDDRTRARIQLDDGTLVTLDRSTELVLVDGAERRARLTVGALVTEVSKIAGKTATFELPRGHVEVLGTKFALRTSADAATVDVSRGAVKLVDHQQRSVVVRAGEEGRVYPGAAPQVTAAPALGRSLGWSESESSDEQGRAAVRGLGELRAKKPGTDDEIEGAVRLTSHQVKVRIVDNMARTEVDEVFTNTTDQVLEGIYRFPLPADGQIESLALEVDGELEQGAFVERERAAKIWRGAIVNAAPHKPHREEIIWVPGPWKDPALLEWQRGGRFELRIFPIPKGGSRRVVLSYTQVIQPTGGLRRYVYPLAHDPSGASQVDHFALDVQLRGHDEAFGVRSQGYGLTAGRAGGAQHLSLTASDFVPTGDLTVEYALPDRDSELTSWSYQPSSPASPAADDPVPGSQYKPVEPVSADGPAPAATAGVGPTAPFVAIALRPELPRQAEQLHRTYVLAVDASRSMVGERYRRAAALAVRVVSELDRLDQVTVLACDSTCQSLPGGLRAPGAQTAADVQAFLAGVRPEGGSDVTAAIVDARAAAGSLEGRALRVIYIGDGTPTVGPLRPAFVTRAVQGVMPADGTLTAVAIGADADLDALGALARGGSGAVIPYVPGQRLMETAFAILGASYGMGLSDVQVELPEGLTEVAPRQLDTIARGGEALLVARLSRPSVTGDLVLRGKVGAKDFEQRYPLQIEPSRGTGNSFVPRLYAALRIAELERSGGAVARQQAVALSSQYNVASRYTSLLVLESQAMFRAFGLDNTRRAPEWTGEEETEHTEGQGRLSAQPSGFFRSALGADSGSSGAGSSGAGSTMAGASVSGGRVAGNRAIRYPMQLSGKSGATQYRPTRPRPADDPPPLKEEAKTKKPVAKTKSGGQAGCAPSDLMCAMRAGQRARDKDRRPQSRSCDINDPLCSSLDRNQQPNVQMQNAQQTIPLRTWPSRGSRRGMVAMRRVWERQASISVARHIPLDAATAKLAEARQAVDQDGNRRAAVKQLYSLLARSGSLDQATQVAEQWADRDALDVDALTARADLAARTGDRDRAIRILGSVVDMRPGDIGAQQRLARLHRWAGAPERGCRHSLALAQLRQDDAKLLTEAVRCTRQTGEPVMADALLSASDAKLRAAVEAALEESAKGTSEDRLRGELRVEASWEGGTHDLDIALIHPDGHRVSWLGAPTRALISASDVKSLEQEKLALLGSKAGEYVIEITRVSGEGPVRGSVRIRAPGDQRTIPFVLDGARVAIGTVTLRWRSRLVPAR